MQIGTRRGRSHSLVFLAVTSLLTFASSGAFAWTLQTLHSFCSQTGCKDGQIPNAALLQDSAGNLFGATQYEGKGGGTIYELVRKSEGKWAFKTLHRFCSSACRSGAIPLRRLIMDTAGNLYGTTYAGGKQDGGIAFELVAPNSQDGKWALVVLRDFCSTTACAHGSPPFSGLSYVGQATGLPYDGSSPLYGVTNRDGKFGAGTVYELTPPAPGNMKWRAKTLYDFCAESGCSDGGFPNAEVTLDASGNLFGTTFGGNAGTVFELQPGDKKWTHTVLHTFCSAQNCSDGDGPAAPLIMDAAGNLFGTTIQGGDFQSGVLFKLTPNGEQSKFKVLYSLGSGGAVPFAGLTMDADGNLFGVATEGGGEQNAGTAFEFTKRGAYNVLYTFCALQNCADGSEPASSMVRDSAGHLFGTADRGGGANAGTVFELLP